MDTQASIADESVAPPPLPQKRILPARERRESAAKRRASSPILATKPTSSTPKKPTPAKTTPRTSSTKTSKKKAIPVSTPVRRPSTPIAEEGLPTKITDSRPLPTLPRPQHPKLSKNEYQTIADSAVLATSLYRSRVKWLVEGVLERYWTKPSKKKFAEELANNPELKSMQRLGSCKVTMGPHAFDATFYTVRESPGHHAPNQFPRRTMPPQPHFQSPKPAMSQPAAFQARPSSTCSDQISQPQVKQETLASSSTATLSTQVPRTVESPRARNPAASRSDSATSKPRPDPVIPMLATRAATNPELKALMKVVASSNATQDQLKLFQSHIDELNNMIRRQEQEQEQEREHEREQQQQQQQQTEPSLMKLHGDEIDSSVPNLPQQDGVGDMTGDLVDSFQSTGTATPPSSYVAHAQQSGYSLPSRQNSVGTSGSYGPTRNLSPFAQYPPQQQKVAMPEARIKAIVLEFTTPASSTIVPCQDRYLFPEYAVLDTPFLGQGLEMVCSFFVIRRGSDLLAQQSAEGAPAGTSVGGLTSWKAEEEYYQPVTLTIKTIHHRILETIARAAKPLAEVQDKMREIMQSKVRVKDDFLAMRLPKEKRTILESMAGRDGGFADSAIEIDDERAGSGDEDDELESFYGI